MHRRVALLFCLLLCVFGAVACGGDDDVDVAKVLEQTFGEDKDIDSGRLDVSLRIDAQGLAQLRGPVSLRLSGPFENRGDQLPNFDLEADLSAGGQSIRAGAVSTGEKGFVTFQGEAYVLSDETYRQFRAGYEREAKKNEGEDEGVSFETLGIDPQRWLRDPTYEGKEDVGGAESLHIRAGIDVPRLLEDVNRILGRAEEIEGQRARQLTDEERQQIAEAIRDARIDLWTGEDDKIMRRLNVALRFEVPEASREQANGLSGGTLRFDLSLGAINDEPQIDEPEDPKPFDDLVAALGQGGQAVPGQGSETPNEAGTAYEECVEAAGADIAKLQECAGLAGG